MNDNEKILTEGGMVFKKKGKGNLLFSNGENALPLWLTFRIITNIFFRKKGTEIILFSSGEKSSKKAAGREPLW